MNQRADHDSKQPKSQYTAFLVRGWYWDEQWRFTVETIGPEREKKHFAGVEALSLYVQGLLQK